MTLVDILQYPLTAMTLTSTWLISGPTRAHRGVGFAVAGLSQPLWFICGWVTHQWALWGLAVVFMFMHLRGFRNNL